MDRLQSNLRRTLSVGDIKPVRLPLAPEVTLYLIGEDYPRGRLPHDEMIAVMNQPAYWAFCWASGQVLARHILDRPDTVRGRTVLDFGAGSGVVAIAAAMAGAARVIACDNDPMALDASLANAELNDVALETLVEIDQLSGPVDLAIAADVLYDRDNMGWLDRLPRLARDVLVADSRVKDVTVFGYELIGRRQATTIPDLDELAEFNDVRLYRANPSEANPSEKGIEVEEQAALGN